MSVPPKYTFYVQHGTLAGHSAVQPVTEQRHVSTSSGENRDEFAFKGRIALVTTTEFVVDIDRCNDRGLPRSKSPPRLTLGFDSWSSPARRNHVASLARLGVRVTLVRVRSDKWRSSCIGSIELRPVGPRSRATPRLTALPSLPSRRTPFRCLRRSSDGYKWTSGERACRGCSWS